MQIVSSYDTICTEVGSVQKGNDAIIDNSFEVTVAIGLDEISFKGDFTSEDFCTGNWWALGGKCEFSDSGTWTAEKFTDSDIPEDDDYEENNVSSDAPLISSGNYTNLKCYDDDWYKVYMEAGKEILVQVFLDSSNVYMGVEIFNSDLSKAVLEKHT